MAKATSNIENRLIECLNSGLTTHGFEKASLSRFHALDDFPLDVWKHKTISDNQAVVFLPLLGTKANPGKLAQAIKMPFGKAIGYVPFFYPLRLHVIFLGNAIVNKAKKLEDFLDRADSYRVILQSIHLVDSASMNSVSVRAPGDIAARSQHEIESSIQTFLQAAKNG